MEQAGEQIKTALDVAMERADRLRIGGYVSAVDVIPPITHPLGSGWNQPPLSEIEINNKQARMSLRTFKSLPEYSGTRPTGVYEGKMWRRHDGVYDRSCPPEQRQWLLCWFGLSGMPGLVSNNYREIVLIDGELPK